MILLFVVGCSTISRCEPCSPVEVNSGWRVPVTRLNFLSDIYGKKQHPSNTAAPNSAQKKHNTKKSQSNSIFYLTIPPPPESPE
jgi:hypothetical protein